MNETIAVVGAGVAGLLLAGALKAQGAEVVVFEKSRGFGGRLATRRVGEVTFDSGARYFTAKGEGFAGDGFGGPRVEGAALSALALAERMAVKSPA